MPTMTQGQVHPIDVPTPGGRAESSGLRVEVIDDLAGLAALRREWQTLYDTIAGGIPFTTYEWTAMWWAHLRRNSRWTRDDLRVFVVRRRCAHHMAVHS